MKLTWGLSNDPLKRFRKGWPKTGVRRQEMSADPLGSRKGSSMGDGWAVPRLAARAAIHGGLWSRAE